MVLKLRIDANMLECGFVFEFYNFNMLKMLYFLSFFFPKFYLMGCVYGSVKHLPRLRS